MVIIHTTKVERIFTSARLSSNIIGVTDAAVDGTSTLRLALVTSRSINAVMCPRVTIIQQFLTFVYICNEIEPWNKIIKNRIKLLTTE